MSFSQTTLKLGVAALVCLYAREAFARVGASGHGNSPPAHSQIAAPHNRAPSMSIRGASSPNYQYYYGGYYPYSSFGYGYGYYGNGYDSPANYVDGSVYAGPFISPSTQAPLPPIPNDHPNVARLTLSVPLGAAVWMQGKLVDMTPTRTFESPALKPGESYKFDVRVVYQENGKKIEEKRTLTMMAGDLQSLQYIALPPAQGEK